MIVDDVPFIREILRRMLETSGYTVVAEAADGDEAVAKYSALLPQVTLMDISLPRKNGVDATKDILSLDKNAKVIMVSALHSDAINKATLESGARGYISKPFTTLNVQSVVHQVLVG